MGFTGKQLVAEVGGKLTLLIVFWAVTAVVTLAFSTDALNAMKDYVLKSSQSIDSIVPLLAATLTVAILYLAALFQKSPNRLWHAAEYTAEIADDLGSVLFLLGWSVLIVFFAHPVADRAALAGFGLLVGPALIAFSKRFGA